MNKRERILVYSDDMKINGVNIVTYNFLNIIPKNKYDIFLMLFRKEGFLLNNIPKYVKIITPPFKKGMYFRFGMKRLIKDKLKQKKYFTILGLFIGILFDKLFRWNFFFRKILFKEEYLQFDYLFNLKSSNIISHIFLKKIYVYKKKCTWIHSEQSLNNNRKYGKVFNNYDFIFCVSKEITNKAQKIYKNIADKMVTLYNPIDGENILKLSNGDSFNDNYNGCRILSVGRLDYIKGFDIAIKTCKILVDKGYDIKWYIVGDGQERENLMNLIKENNLENKFVLLGEKENPYPFFKESDIYVQSSRSEGYCLTLAEAKIFNKPIVTTIFPGTYEQIKDNETGIIVETTPESIAAGVQKLLDNKELREKLINNLKEENKKPRRDYFTDLKKFL